MSLAARCPSGAPRSRSRNRTAAVIGPIVCDDEGPTPILNMSKPLRNMPCLKDEVARFVHDGGGRMIVRMFSRRSESGGRGV
jgi:hypothetical protein